MNELMNFDELEALDEDLSIDPNSVHKLEREIIEDCILKEKKYYLVDPDYLIKK